MLEFCHIETEISSSVKEGVQGWAGPSEALVFQHSLQIRLNARHWDACRNGREKPQAGRGLCLWHQSRKPVLRSSNSSLALFIPFSPWKSEVRGKRENLLIRDFP